MGGSWGMGGRRGDYGSGRGPCNRKPRRRVFQRLEKFFARFPMIGKIFRDFSNDWKKFFQWLENSAGFSNDWKKSFQWLENFFPMGGKFSGARGRRGRPGKMAQRAGSSMEPRVPMVSSERCKSTGKGAVVAWNRKTLNKAKRMKRTVRRILRAAQSAQTCAKSRWRR